MFRNPLPMSRRLVLVVLQFGALLAFSARLLPQIAPQSTVHRQVVHSVVSHSILTPALRSPEVWLRFSRDGSYLLLQEPTGVAVLQESPLRILIHIAGDNLYSAEFSTDSQNLILVSRRLAYAKWKLPQGEKIASGDLPSQVECADGRLSPGGEFFACLKPNFHFVLFDISTGKSFFEDSVAPALPRDSRGLRSLYPSNVLYFSSLDLDSAFPGPFGIIHTSEPQLGPNHALYPSSIHFSPDGKMLVARLPKGAFAVDIASRKRFEPPEAVQKAIHTAAELATTDHLIAAENEKGSQGGSTASVFSLRSGDVLAKMALTAQRLQIASNPRFLLWHNLSADGVSAGAFDLEQNRSLETPPAVALDVQTDQLAVYTQNGAIALYRVGGRNLTANLQLPLAMLPLLRSASVTPSLDKLAFSVDGAGAVFDLPAGQRIAALSRFSAVNFLDQREASMLFPRFHEDAARVSRVDLSKGEVSPSWEVGKEEQLRSGGPILIHYSLLKGIMNLGDIPQVGVEPPYALRALDPGTGKELWKREFTKDPPTPFANPQGERLVLGWKAKSSEAKSVASRNPALREILKNSKFTDHDSYFEAVDARSGKSIGGVFVTAGSGASTFDAASSAGDSIILQKDGVRVSLYSLSDGQLKARLVGVRPNASAESNLLSLDMGEGRLGIFDLNTGVKLDEQLFPEALAYTHFSGDGKRLFVLTEHQTALILDVSNARNTSIPKQ